MGILKFLIFYTVLQESLLKWLPTNDGMHLLLRQIPNLLILFAVLWTAVTIQFSSSRQLTWIGGGADRIFFLFLISAAVSLATSQSDSLVIGVLNFGVLVRHVLVLYLVILLQPSPGEMRQAITLLLACVFLQMLVGIIQFVGGLPVKELLAARNIEFAGISKSFTGSRDDQVNDLIGTMGNTINFGYFMMVGLVVAFSRMKPTSIVYWGFTMLTLIMIYLSGSRGIFLATIGIVVLHQAWVRGATRTVLLIIALSLLVVPVFLVAPTQSVVGADRGMDLAFIFSEKYIETAKNQRLGLVLYVLPSILATKYAFFGYGPDRFAFTDAAVSFVEVPQILIAVLPEVLEDVYWIALIVYYGVIGAFLWIVFVFSVGRKVYKIAKRDHLVWTNPYSEMAVLLFVVSIPLNFLNQAYDTWSFSFYMWLFAGFAIVKGNARKSRVR